MLEISPAAIFVNNFSHLVQFERSNTLKNDWHFRSLKIIRHRLEVETGGCKESYWKISQLHLSYIIIFHIFHSLQVVGPLKWWSCFSFHRITSKWLEVVTDDRKKNSLATTFVRNVFFFFNFTKFGICKSFNNVDLNNIEVRHCNAYNRVLEVY